ncbi:MAG TPA: hypothetical protein VGM58_03095 [Verrucomicrobiae bacterium]|jgi:hypothetical protein
MRISTYILFLSLLVICSCSTHQAYLKASKNYIDTYHDNPPRYFWKGNAAINGQTVLLGIRSGDEQSRTNVQRLIGSTVVFVGDSDESRKGVFSDLQTHRVDDLQPHDKDIKIEVDIIPFRDVHPGMCGSWVAEVRGTLESVDFEKRIIRITAKPEDWKVRATY